MSAWNWSSAFLILNRTKKAVEKAKMTSSSNKPSLLGIVKSGTYNVLGEGLGFAAIDSFFCVFYAFVQLMFLAHYLLLSLGKISIRNNRIKEGRVSKKNYLLTLQTVYETFRRHTA
jgi:L-asparagine transporter-like permease